MPTVTLTDETIGQPNDPTPLNNNWAALRAVLNAGLDKNNFAASPDLPFSVLHGYPSDGTLFAAGDGTWKSAGSIKTKYGQLDIAGNSAETNLISQTIGANTIGVNGRIRGGLDGDFLQQSGGNAAFPRFKLYYGASPIIDTGTAAQVVASQAGRYGWEIEFTVSNQDAAHQYGKFKFRASLIGTGAGGVGIGVTQALATESAYQEMFWFTNGLANVDSTVSQTLKLTVTNASNNASYSTRMQSGLVEIL